MKSFFSKTLLFVFLSSLTFTLFVPAQTNEKVRGDEYEVYSAFIGQVYLSDFILEWFTIKGEKSRYSEGVAKIEQVVIFPNTMHEPSNGYFAFANAPYKTEIPKNLFNSFLTQNKQSYKLADRFKVKVKHDLFTQTAEEAQAYSAEAQRRKVSYDVLFLEKYPKSGGTLVFYRVGFDKSRKKALVGVAQRNITNPKYVTNRRGGYQVALLSKSGKQWLVRKVFPEIDDIQIDFEKCESMTKHIGLALGSTSFSVLRKEDGLCRVSESWEIEGGGWTTECLVPPSLGKISIAAGSLLTEGIPFYYSKNISKYCEKPKSNSIFFSQVVPAIRLR